MIYPLCQRPARRFMAIPPGVLHVNRRNLIASVLLPAVFVLLAAQPAQCSDKKKEAAQATIEFDERAAAGVLGTIRDGLEGHSQRLLLSAFDGEKMEGFEGFRDQIEAYFTRYEGFRVSYHIVQTSEENERGVILVDFLVENTPRGGGRISRREGQLRFELERGPKGWKIVDFSPRGYFS